MPTSTSTDKHDMAGDNEQAFGNGLNPSEGHAIDRHGRTALPEAETHRRRSNTAVSIKMLLVVSAVLLLALVIYFSYSNRANYYLTAAQGAIEIWQGRFAPMGKERVLILPGAQPPWNLKNVYSQNEINTIAFNYYIDRADILLEAPDMPDFNGIKFYLNTAVSYTVTDEQRRLAAKRLNNVDMMIYLYKADVASSKGTLADFKMALAYMAKAAALDLDAAQSDLVNMKIQSIKELMAPLQDNPGKRPEASASPPKDRQGLQPISESPVKQP